MSRIEALKVKYFKIIEDKQGYDFDVGELIDEAARIAVEEEKERLFDALPKTFYLIDDAMKKLLSIIINER